MAWCHACEEKKHNIEKIVTGNFSFKAYKKYVERQRRKKQTNFSFYIRKKK